MLDFGCPSVHPINESFIKRFCCAETWGCGVQIKEPSVSAEVEKQDSVVMVDSGMIVQQFK